MTWIKNHEKAKDLLVDNLYDFLGALMFGIGFYNFAENGGFAPGGVTGMALLIREFVPDIPLGLLSFLINIPFVCPYWEKNICCAASAP